MRTINQLLQRYRYDAVDVLIQVEPAGRVTQTRFYRGEHLVTQLDGQNSQSVFQHHKQLLALCTRDDTQTRSQLLTTDQQRSVLQVGAVQHRYAPYGHRLATIGLDSLLGFNGEVPDPVTGHYLLGNGHRAFNPVLMRFNSPDSLSPFRRGGLNPYVYCLGDPVNFSDPAGRFAELGRLLTSLMGVSNTTLGMTRTVPSFNLAKDALMLGALKKLPFRQSFTAASTVTASGLVLTTALVGVASAVTAIVDEPEAGKILGYVALGLTALALGSRAGTYVAARKPGTEAALKQFVQNKGRIVSATPSPTPPASIELSLRSVQDPQPSAPDLSLFTPDPSTSSAGFFADNRHSWMTPEIEVALDRLGGQSPSRSTRRIRQT
ncbi:RHS repeat-associated core domain-containing protein [Pseudomonas vancouverensis]|uniref:RHS repeat-associated core domain-containing protein n=1 Tax=Pseudomonas vancouverensis TaxID=95300 RepID=UPI003CFD3A10